MNFFSSESLTHGSEPGLGGKHEKVDSFHTHKPFQKSWTQCIFWVASPLQTPKGSALQAPRGLTIHPICSGHSPSWPRDYLLPLEMSITPTSPVSTVEILASSKAHRKCFFP